MIFYLYTEHVLSPLMKDFRKRLQAIISRTNRSTYLKEIFLHLETHPEDSRIFWNYDKMQILILQILIEPFIGEFTNEGTFINGTNNENTNILQQTINMGMNQHQNKNISQENSRSTSKSDSESDNSFISDGRRNKFNDKQNMKYDSHTSRFLDAQKKDNNDRNSIFSGGPLRNKTFQNVITILNILQIIVNDPTIRLDFIKLHLPFYIYPYLNRPSLSKQSESLRIASLGVFGQLLKEKDTRVLNYLMSTEMVPFCLKLMDIGTPISKKISIYIFYSILQTEEGLEYACQTFERFIAITVILNSMCQQIYDQYDLLQQKEPMEINITSDQPDFSPLLSPIIDCYLRLVHKSNVLLSFRAQQPDVIIDKRMRKLMGKSKQKWEQLKKIIEEAVK